MQRIHAENTCREYMQRIYAVDICGEYAPNKLGDSRGSWLEKVLVA
jgi:hypothetical protein